MIPGLRWLQVLSAPPIPPLRCHALHRFSLKHHHRCDNYQRSGDGDEPGSNRSRRFWVGLVLGDGR